MKNVKLVSEQIIGGKVYAVDAIVQLDDNKATWLINSGAAVNAGEAAIPENDPPFVAKDEPPKEKKPLPAQASPVAAQATAKTPPHVAAKAVEKPVEKGKHK